MSPKQKALYFKTWQAVARQCPELDRHEFHIQIFGEDKSSLTFTNEDLDKFLEVAWRITKPADVNAQLRQMNQQKTRLIWKIEIYLANFLRLYRDDPAAYTIGVLRDQHPFALPEPDAHASPTFGSAAPTGRTNIAQGNALGITPEKSSSPEGASYLHSALESLSVENLENLRSTLTARLNDMRKHAGHTIHDMHVLAGVQCECAPCCKRRRLAALNHSVPEPLPF